MVENQKEIEQALGLEEGKLSEMITSEEKHTIDLEPLVIEKKTIYEERISNIKKEEFKHGQEKFFKTVRDAFGLEVTGKTSENLISGLKTYVETEKEKGGAEPEEKYKTLKADFESFRVIWLQKKLSSQHLKLQLNRKKKPTKLNQHLQNIFRPIH